MTKSCMFQICIMFNMQKIVNNSFSQNGLYLNPSRLETIAFFNPGVPQGLVLGYLLKVLIVLLFLRFGVNVRHTHVNVRHTYWAPLYPVTEALHAVEFKQSYILLRVVISFCRFWRPSWNVNSSVICIWVNIQCWWILSPSEPDYRQENIRFYNYV